jgi:uncharacterized membrane protein YeiH
METLSAILTYGGVAVFAATGAIAAANRKHTIVEFIFFATITGIGGGTLRDLLLGVPVFWMHENSYLAVCAGVAVATWLLGTRVWHFRTLLWLDAIGLAAFSVIGSAKALGLGVPPLVAIVMGVMTGTFGGIIRDVLANQPSILLGREIYVSAAILGASVFVGLTLLGIGTFVAGMIGALAGFALRAAALSFGWTLPGYRERRGDPGR